MPEPFFDIPAEPIEPAEEVPPAIMKQTFITMSKDAATALQNTIGIGYANDPDKLQDGSGFTFDHWIDENLGEYWVCCDETIFDAAIDELLAQGMTMTFRPEPEPVVEEEFPEVPIGN